jgi:hypothetical protein
MPSWIAVDMGTGRLIADLPGLVVQRVGSVLGAYTSTSAELPLPGAPENWERAVLEGAAVLVLVDDEQRPLWGGSVLRTERGLGDTVKVDLASLEAYLDRCYVGDVTFTGVSQTQIVADLIDAFVNDGSIEIRVEAAVSTTLRDRTYKRSQDKTIYSVLTELSGVQGGPEWTVGWEWQHSPERITPVLRVADRIGSGVAPGFGPGATFEAPGPVRDVRYVRDYGSGKGANRVLAVSTAAADVRPESTPAEAAVSERPTFEYRFTPSTSITQTETLDGHAQRALALMQDGAVSLTLVVDAGAGPRLGVDWGIGDDIGYRIGDSWTDVEGLFPGDDVFPGEGTLPELPSTRKRFTVPGFPDGLSGVARCIGWEMNLSEPVTVEPILSGVV